MSSDPQDLTTTDSAVPTAQSQSTNTTDVPAIKQQPQAQQKQKSMLPPPTAIANDTTTEQLAQQQQQQQQQYALPPFSKLSQYGGNNFASSSPSKKTSLPPFNNLASKTDSEVQVKSEINLPPASSIINETTPKNVPGNSTSVLEPAAEQSQLPTSEQQAKGSFKSETQETVETSNDQISSKASPPNQRAASYKPLNVKDALNYLDQVKFQFREQTDIYNNFLDIMKDFKSQNIDTPGVIERVSTLFKGHPELIDGFNTFLPQGFAIECSTTDPNTIIVTTPQGTSIRKDNAISESSAQPASQLQHDQQLQQEPHQELQHQQQHQQQQEQQQQLQQQQLQQQQLQQQQLQLQQQHQSQHPPQQVVINQLPGVDSNAPEGYAYHMHPQAQYSRYPNGELPPGYDQQAYQQQLHLAQQQQLVVEPKQSTPAEFDQAINYVNKIKQRYANQPDIYKLFLENLQMYQKGIKPINEVYHEISILFRDAPDLLEDFKLFMPDNTVVRDPQQEYTVAQPPLPPTQIYQSGPGVQLPPVGNFQPVAFRNGQEELLQSQYPQAYHQQQMHQQLQPGPPSQSQVMLDPQSQKENQQLMKERKKKEDIVEEGYPLSDIRTTSREVPCLLPGVPDPVYPKAVDSDLTNELNFFDKLKKAIGNKQTYNEFLKIIRLYNSDVIDKRTLMEKTRGFIGGLPDMYQWFKIFVGWEDTPLRIENVAIKKQPLDLLMCKPCGPSYRKLPKSQTHMACSGRDAICWEVFNDDWVGHPVWASEESGFIAHRKNQYEEILFRIEDERHEYDYYMEANTRTIQTLETIANRLANMSDEEKANFKLPPGLGHTSNAIYKRVIRKIYDKDRGWEVIDALHEHPAITVPIVLKRLKQKDEEWKRAQREWNKVWREAEQKLMLKALDHLGLQFKNIDKKLLTNKHLVQELSTVKQEQQTKKLHPLMTRPKSQLVCKYEDFSIFIDIFKLVQISLKHQGYSRNEKSKIDSFFKSFIIDFFFLDAEFIDSELLKRGLVEEDEHEDKEPTPDLVTQEEELPTLSQTKKRSREHDLLKDVLRKNKKKKLNEDDESTECENSTVNDSNAINENGANEASEPNEKVQPNWITNDNFKPAVGDVRSEYNMFCNTQIYVFYRYLDTLYKRLLEVKNLSQDANEKIKLRKITKFASDLGLVDNHLKDLGIAITGNDSYVEALGLCEKLIDKKLEANDFEEALREGFSNKAYKMFTIDRVVTNIVKFIHNLMSDNKCGEILLLMEKDRQQVKTSAKDQIMYRIEVRNFMNPDENMFKITYDREAKVTNITFLALDDLTISDESEEKEGKWNYYLTSYSMSHPTEGIDASKINLPFLKSLLDEDDDEDEISGVSESKLSVKIDMDTYRMRFDPETYDLFIRDSLFLRKTNGKSSEKARLTKLSEVINGDMGVAGDLGSEEALKLADERLKVLFEKGPDEYLKVEKRGENEVEQKENNTASESKVEKDKSPDVAAGNSEIDINGENETNAKANDAAIEKLEEKRGPIETESTTS